MLLGGSAKLANTIRSSIRGRRIPSGILGGLPDRFHLNGRYWDCMGYEAFKELLQKVEDFHVTIYGSTGLLATGNSCSSRARRSSDFWEECRIFLACRSPAKNPVGYIQKAMLLAWADEDDKQDEIMTLETMGATYFFRQATPVVIFVDQMNALEAIPGELDSRCGGGYSSKHKPIFSASANCNICLLMRRKQTNSHGLTLSSRFADLVINYCTIVLTEFDLGAARDRKSKKSQAPSRCS
jgi:hypothetical protein